MGVLMGVVALCFTSGHVAAAGAAESSSWWAAGSWHQARLVSTCVPECVLHAAPNRGRKENKGVCARAGHMSRSDLCFGVALLLSADDGEPHARTDRLTHRVADLAHGGAERDPHVPAQRLAHGGTHGPDGEPHGEPHGEPDDGFAHRGGPWALAAPESGAPRRGGKRARARPCSLSRGRSPFPGQPPRSTY